MKEKKEERIEKRETDESRKKNTWGFQEAVTICAAGDPTP